MEEAIKIYADRDYVDGKGLPDGAGVYQQLVTGADGKAKWEDRYGYKKVSESVFAAEQTVSTSKAPYGSSISGSGVCNGDIVYGKTYRVTFNGVDYNCVAHTGSYSMNFLGDSALSTANVSDGSDKFSNGEPFAVRTNAGTFYLFAESAGEYTVTISEVEEEIVPIPAEYLPATAVVITKQNGVVSCNTPLENIPACIMKGTPWIYVRDDGETLESLSDVEPNYVKAENVCFINVYGGSGSFLTGFEYNANGITESVDG